MVSLPRALSLALGQLGDRAILRVLGKSLVVTLAIFIAAAVALNAALPALLSDWLDLGGDVYLVLTALVFIIGAWLLFRIVALAVLQFFADEIVHAVEAKHYPAHAASARTVPFAEELSNSLRATGRVIFFNLLAAPIAIALLFTAIGPAIVFWFVNALLLGRELQDMVWLRHRQDKDEVQPVGGLTRFALGGVVAGLLAIPFINLLAPIIGAASATHLVHRSNRKTA